MSKSSQVIIVAPDRGLRRSLEFALEVEGLVALSFETVFAALASPPAAESICIIIDDEALLYEPLALDLVRRLNKAVVLLVDRHNPVPQPPNIKVLRKPLFGNALIKAVKSTEVPMT